MSVPVINRVVIDKGVLAGFKARALRAYPTEYSECLWGFVEDTTALITSIERVCVEEATEDSIEIDTEREFGDVVNGHTLIGTIHTHPDEDAAPSDTDLADADGEWFFGICAINKLSGRRYVSFSFFSPTGKHLELAISESDKEKRL